ncbi:hypothetical protein SRHO_G00312900 [Serrasalmus rhombeus]
MHTVRIVVCPDRQRSSNSTLPYPKNPLQWKKKSRLKDVIFQCRRAEGTGDKGNGVDLSLPCQLLDVVFSSLHGGTHSCEAKFEMKKSKEDNFSFTKHVIKCSFTATK